MDILLSLVFAFLVCGVLSAIFHAIMMIFKLKPPVVLIIGFSLGALLVALAPVLPFDIFAWLESVGGAGMSITVMAAGGASCGNLMLFFAGNAIPLITVLCVFVSLAILGLIAGAIGNRRRDKEEN